LIFSSWLECAKEDAHRDECLDIGEEGLPGSGRVVILAPHPDDPEVSAVFQRTLVRGGWSVRWIILTSAWSGVRDEFVGSDKAAKGAARRVEQTESARLFGLDPDELVFMDLPEIEDGSLAEIPESFERMSEKLDRESPDIVILPWGMDSNPTHGLVFRWFEKWREGHGGVTAFYQQDPKSVDFTPHLRVLFDEESACWKASLLECHRSQTERNTATRGITFSERILAVHRQAAEGSGKPYVEAYRVSGRQEFGE